MKVLFVLYDLYDALDKEIKKRKKELSEMSDSLSYSVGYADGIIWICRKIKRGLDKRLFR